VKPSAGGGRQSEAHHRMMTLVVSRPGIYRVEVIEVTMSSREGVALSYDSHPLYFWCAQD
jgi:hypothetical protein